jgi:hypothetical protein
MLYLSVFWWQFFWHLTNTFSLTCYSSGTYFMGSLLLLPTEHGSFTYTAGINRSNRHCLTKAPAGGSDRPVQSAPVTGRTGPARNWSDISVQPVGCCFGQTVPGRPPFKHGCSSTAWTAVFDRLMPAVIGHLPRFFVQQQTHFRFFKYG